MPLLDEIIAKINEDEDEEQDGKNGPEGTKEGQEGDSVKREGLITYSDEFYKAFEE